MKRLICFLLALVLIQSCFVPPGSARSRQVGSDRDLLDVLAGMCEKRAVGFHLELKKAYFDALTDDDLAGLGMLFLQAGITSYRLRYTEEGDLTLDDVRWTEPHLAEYTTESEGRQALEAFLTEGLAACQLVTAQQDVYENFLTHINEYATLCGVQAMTVRNALSAPYVIWLEEIRYYPGRKILLAIAAEDDSVLTYREAKTMAAARELAAQCRRETSLETALAIHDALCDIITYTNDEYRQEDDNAIGALLRGQANCDGYADAFYLVGSLAGLEVRYQHGSSRKRTADRLYQDVTHMWNLLKLNGTWRLVDITWDDQENQTVHTWFNIGADRARRMHRWNEEISIPLLEKTDLAARPGTEYLIRDLADITACTQNAADNRYPSFTIVLPDESSLSGSDLLAALKTTMNRSFSYSWNEYMRTMTVE